MTLSTSIYTPGCRIDYEYETRNGKHTVWLAANGVLRRGSAGDVINALAPYRHFSQIEELIKWLAKF